MKRFETKGVLAAFGILALLLIVSPQLKAQFAFITNNAAITITGFTGTNGEAVVPDTTNGYMVVGIGASAFQYSAITNVLIPDTITSIGDEAFFGCASLTNLALPASIGYIGTFAFWNCTALTSISIPGSVTNASNGAFFGCSGLTNVTIMEGATIIGSEMFEGCTSLTNFYIPGSVTNIGATPFLNCSNLSIIVVDSNNPAFSSDEGVLFDKAKSALIQYPQGKNGSYNISEGVVTIEAWAFTECVLLTDITIPDSVSTIGTSAFAGCTGLRTILLPNSVTNIGSGAFSSCSQLAAFTADAGNPDYLSDGGVLYDRNQTTLVQCPGAKPGTFTIPNSVTNIESYAFSACELLTDITIPNSVKSIGGYAFSGCNGFTNITLPNSIASIPTGLFISCTNLITISLPSSITNIGADAFWGCTSLSRLTIPTSVVSIGAAAFSLCEHLGNVSIPSSITSIGTEAFYECYSLTNLTIDNSADNITGIGASAFANCPALKSVYFRGNPPMLNFYIFNSDNSATVYYLPGTIGWGPTFNNLPAKLWNPQPQTKNASFGIRTNRFGFNITGTAGLIIVVDACTNFSNPVWVPLATKTLTGGAAYFADPQWTNFPGRYYRIRSP